MAGPLMAMMTQMGGMAFGSQLGQALGQLSREVLTSTDIGLPLGPKGVAALMPEAIEALSEGLEQPRSEIMTFLAAREAAHHRLFSHVPWLSSQLLGAVEAYAKGMKIDMSGIEELAQGFNPASLTDPVADGAAAQPGHLRAEGHPGADRRARAAGDAAGADRGLGADRGRPTRSATGSPARRRCRETLRRRRATGGPAEQTFATLVGLELRPRKMREAAVLWERLTEAVGVDARDARVAAPRPAARRRPTSTSRPAFIDRMIGGDTSGLDIDSAIAEFQTAESEDDDKDGPTPRACG